MGPPKDSEVRRWTPRRPRELVIVDAYDSRAIFVNYFLCDMKCVVSVGTFSVYKRCPMHVSCSVYINVH